MILGLISDIHGNTTALNAVIDDVRQLGVEQWWVLGDVVALGPDPVGVLQIPSDRLDYIAGLGSELRLSLPDGTRVLGIHASQRSDDGQGIDTRISDADLGDTVAGCEADLVFAGHTHDATDRVVEQIRAVNLGSLSNPRRLDRCVKRCGSTDEAAEAGS